MEVKVLKYQASSSVKAGNNQSADCVPMTTLGPCRNIIICDGTLPLSSANDHESRRGCELIETLMPWSAVHVAIAKS